jgi:hypothetical protein
LEEPRQLIGIKYSNFRFGAEVHIPVPLAHSDDQNTGESNRVLAKAADLLR